MHGVASKKRDVADVVGEPNVGVARIDGLISDYATRLSARELEDPGRAEGVRRRVRDVLHYHAQQYAHAGSPCPAETLIANLGRGQFAFGSRPDHDLWCDVFLAFLLAERIERGVHLFRHRFTDQIAQWCKRYGQDDAELADDLLADLLLPRAQSGPRIESYRAHGPLDSWLREVVRTQAHRRRRARGVVLAVPESPSRGGPAGRSVCGGAQHRVAMPDDQYLRDDCTRHLAPVLNRVLAELTPRQRTVLLLSAADGVPQSRIGKLLGVPYYTVSRLKSKAIETVRRRFFRLARQVSRMDDEAVWSCLRLILDAFPQSGLRIARHGTPPDGKGQEG